MKWINQQTYALYRVGTWYLFRDHYAVCEIYSIFFSLWSLLPLYWLVAGVFVDGNTQLASLWKCSYLPTYCWIINNNMMAFGVCAEYRCGPCVPVCECDAHFFMCGSPFYHLLSVAFSRNYLNFSLISLERCWTFLDVWVRVCVCMCGLAKEALDK